MFQERDARLSGGEVPAIAAPVVAQRTSWGGLPLYWAPLVGSFCAGLIFRVGHADESLARAGITHLVEHLALSRRTALAVDFNGAVGGSLAWFWASGAQPDVLRFLGDVAADLRELPDNLGTERRVLMTESERHGDSITTVAKALRFGPQSYGLAGYPEYGLRGLEIETVRGWARERFNHANAVVWMSGEPPGESELALPRGEWFAPPAPVSRPTGGRALVHPSAPGGAALSLLIGRRPAAAIATEIAVKRASDVLRHQHGLSYVVDMSCEALTASDMHSVLYCDCQRGKEQRTTSLLAAVIEELAVHGPTGEELEREIVRRRIVQAEGDISPAHLFARASEELFDSSPIERRDLVADAEQVTVDDVRLELELALQTALLLAATEPTDLPDRWTVHDDLTDRVVSGRRYRRRALLARDRRTKSVHVTASTEGISLVLSPGRARTVAFADCVGAERWPGGARLLISADGTELLINPRDWRHGEELQRLIDSQLGSERLIAVNARAEAQVEQLKRKLPKAHNDLAVATRQLPFDELPIDAIPATDGTCRGLLILTEERLLFVAHEQQHANLPLDEVQSIRPDRPKKRGRQRFLVTSDSSAQEFVLASKHAPEQFLNSLTKALQASGNPPTIAPPLPRHARHAARIGILAALLTFVILFPLAELEDPSSHQRILLLSTLVLVINGGLSAAGLWAGRIGRRHSTAGWRRLEANVAVALSAGALALWLFSGISIPVAQW